MTTMPARLAPLATQYDWARGRLLARLAGGEAAGEYGLAGAVLPMTDEEHLWEPAAGCWSVRRRADGPGQGAEFLVGAGEWGRDSAKPPHPSPPPVTTIAWRLAHLSESLAMRADHMTGSHALTRDEYEFHGDAAGAVAAFEAGSLAWRAVLDEADEAALDQAGRSTYPHGADPDIPFIELAWWVNLEVIHHGAEIALLRDLYRARQG
jgi:hypothetical protein